MGFGELILLSVALSMDAFAVSICKGLATKEAGLRTGLTCGLWFGGFQALMPLTGFYLGRFFAEAIQTIDHWVAFVLLAAIGINMLREAFSKSCDSGEDEQDSDMSFKTMFLLAIATSIDALAVGISLAMVGNVKILTAVLLIGACTFLLCTTGVRIGNIFGAKLGSKAHMAGGIILIVLGIKILLEHLGILP